VVYNRLYLPFCFRFVFVFPKKKEEKTEKGGGEVENQQNQTKEIKNKTIEYCMRVFCV